MICAHVVRNILGHDVILFEQGNLERPIACMTLTNFQKLAEEVEKETEELDAELKKERT